MSNFALKSKENRIQRPRPPPITTLASNTSSSAPRRTVGFGTTTTTVTTAKPSGAQYRRSVPTAIGKTPDLLHPPKFGGQQLSNRNCKPDITKNLPSKTVQKPPSQPCEPVAQSRWDAYGYNYLWMWLFWWQNGCQFDSLWKDTSDGQLEFTSFMQVCDDVIG